MPSENERAEIELQILKYRSLARRVVRDDSIQRINRLIAELEQRLREIDKKSRNSPGKNKTHDQLDFYGLIVADIRPCAKSLDGFGKESLCGRSAAMPGLTPAESLTYLAIAAVCWLGSRPARATAASTSSAAITRSLPDSFAA